MKRYAVAYGAWLGAVLIAAAVAYYYYRRVLAIGEAELAKMNGQTVPARRRVPTPEPELVEPPASPATGAASSSGDGAEPPIEEWSG